jgi:hypothetical protein
VTQKSGLATVINHETQSVPADNPSFLGMSTAWEPNIANGKIDRLALVDYENASLNDNGVQKGGEVSVPHSTHKESIIASLPCIIQGLAKKVAASLYEGTRCSANHRHVTRRREQRLCDDTKYFDLV